MKRLFLVLAFALAARAQDVINPDRPGIADGSATVSRGVFQIEIGGERDDDVWSTPTLLRYGLAPSFELRVEANDWNRDDVSVGFKKHFGSTPFGLIGRVFANGDADARLAADYELNEKWSLNPNIGLAYEDSSTTALAAMTLQYNLSDKLNVFVDGSYQSPDQLLFDGGVAWILGTRTQLDFSVGWGAHGDDVPGHFVSAGISRAF